MLGQSAEISVLPKRGHGKESCIKYLAYKYRIIEHVDRQPAVIKKERTRDAKRYANDLGKRSHGDLQVRKRKQTGKICMITQEALSCYEMPELGCLMRKTYRIKYSQKMSYVSAAAIV